MTSLNLRLLATRRLWSVAAGLLTLTILVSGYLYSERHARKHRNEVAQQLAVVAELKSQQLLRWRRERLGDAAYLHGTPYVARRAVDVLKMPASAATRQMLDASLKPFVREGSFDHLLLLDTDLSVRWTWPTNASTTLAEATRRDAVGALRSRQVVVTDLHRETEDGPVLLTIMVPFVVRQEGNKENVPAAGRAGSPSDRSVGVLVMQIRADDALFPMVRDWPTPTRTAETLLLRREGEELVCLNDLRHWRDAALQLRLPLTNTALPEVAGFLGKAGVRSGRDYRGTPVLAVAKAIPKTPWVLVAKKDEDEIRGEAGHSTGFLALALGSLILLVAAGAAYGYRRHQAGVFRNLYESERREREAQAIYRTTLYSLGDAVITTDTAGRVQDLNPVAEKLTGWTEREARGRPLAEVFRILSEETRAPVTNPAERVLREGKVMGLANQTLLVARDGTERPIADSAAPIRKEDGTVSGIVLVFSDQTERHAAREALREREAFIRAVMDNLPIGVAVNSVEPAVQFSYMNDNFPRLYRTTREALARPDAFWEAVYEDPAFREEIKQRVLADCASGDPARMQWEDIPLTRRGSETTFVSARNSLIPGKPLMISTVWDVTDRHKAGERLRLQSGALEAAANAILITDRAGTIQWVNRAFTELTGYTAQEVIGQNPRLLRSGQHDTAFYRSLWDTILSGHGWRGEIINRHKDGHLYTGETTITPVTDQHGEITHFIGVQQDVTERKRTEAQVAAFASLGQRLSAAKTSREAAETIVAVADELIGWDACSLDLYLSKEDRLLHVLNLDTWNGRRVDCPAPEPSSCPSPLARGVLQRAEGRLILKDNPEQMLPEGSPFGNTDQPSAAILMAPIRRGPAVIGLISLHSYTPQAYDARDLETLQALADHCGGALDRLRAEEAWRESEEQYRALIEQAQDVVFTVAPDQTITSLNPAFETLSGFAREDWLGRPFAGLCDPEELPQLMRLFEEALQNQPLPRFEARVRTKKGGSLTVEFTITQQSKDGRVVGLMGIARDVTEQRRLETQLRHSQKMEAIGQLAGGVAHDFNNMLAVIRGNAELLLLDADHLSHPAGEGLKQISAAADRAANLTRQLLAFSRRQVMRLQPTDLNDVVTNLTKMLKRIIGEHIELQCIYGGGLPSVQADVGMLEQVLMNLVVNARDAMPQGGQLVIRTGQLHLVAGQGLPHPEAYAGDFVWLSVSDTGVGIAPAHLPQIFEPFFTTKEPGKGTGLGLATVYGIIKQHRGWVEVSSIVKLGSTFRIVLPAAPTAASAAAVAEEPPPRGGHESILLVEDEPAVRRLTRRVLESFGYRVAEAASGSEALDLWRQRGAPFDLLLTDMVMPGGVTGRELAEQLRADRPALKVIYLSGYTGAQASQDTQFLQRTGSCYLQKPCPTRVLLRAVREQLDASLPPAPPGTTDAPLVSRELDSRLAAG